MNNLPKDQIIELLVRVVEDFTFKDYVPQGYLGDKSNLTVIASHFQKKIITESVVNQAITDISFKEVLNKFKFDEKKSTDNEIPLKNIPEVNCAAIAAQVYELLHSIPIEYQFILMLPSCKIPIEKIQLAHNIEIVSVDDALINLYDNQASKNILHFLTSNNQNLKKNDVVLMIKGKGYVSNYGTIKINVDPIFIWKQIIGVYECLNIIHKVKKVTYAELHQKFTYKAHAKDGQHIQSLSESIEDNQYISQMEFDISKMEPCKKAETPFDYANKALTNLFSKEDNTSGHQMRIKLGAYWYYKCKSSHEEYFLPIWITAAFDALVGQENYAKEKKAELIANSVSADIAAEEEIYKLIINLYALRNKIVHGKKEISSFDQYCDLDDNPTIDIVMLYQSQDILKKYLALRIKKFSKSITNCN